jgi:hypothetical protein
MLHYTKRAWRFALAAVAASTLAACAGGPAANISLIPTATGEQTSKQGLFTQPLKWKHVKPGCKGDCPTLELDSIVFPGMPRLTELVDHALATMTGIGDSGPPPYMTVAEYEDFFWKTAAPRDSTLLAAKARYRNQNITVVQLTTWQYLTGAAHGISATQFLNWDNAAKTVLGLDNVLEPGQRDAYVAALKMAHDRWLADNAEARADPGAYSRLWPFQPSDNFAFSDQGLVVKYDSYQLAPYSSGQPELVIPYSDLAGVLRPEFLPR